MVCKAESLNYKKMRLENDFAIFGIDNVVLLSYETNEQLNPNL